MTENYELIVFDMDGVLVDVTSSWAWVHDYFEVDNQDSLELYEKGKIDDREFVRRDIQLWKNSKGNLSKKDIIKILEKAPLMEGFDDCIPKLSETHQLAIISGGLKPLARMIGDKYFDIIMANDIFENNGTLAEEGKIEVKLNGKDEAFELLLNILNVEDDKSVAVGNSHIDAPMLKKAEKGIAFNPNDDKVQEAADTVIEKKDLSLLLKKV